MSSALEQIYVSWRNRHISFVTVEYKRCLQVLANWYGPIEYTNFSEMCKLVFTQVWDALPWTLRCMLRKLNLKLFICQDYDYSDRVLGGRKSLAWYDYGKIVLHQPRITHYATIEGLSLPRLVRGLIVHEIGHAVGIYEEKELETILRSYGGIW